MVNWGRAAYLLAFSNFDIDEVYIMYFYSQYYNRQKSFKVCFNEDLCAIADKCPGFKWETVFECLLIILSKMVS